MLDPERCLLSELVIHNWRNVEVFSPQFLYYALIASVQTSQNPSSVPWCNKGGNYGVRVQISDIKWAAEPSEWREYLIKDIHKELPLQLLKLRR